MTLDQAKALRPNQVLYHQTLTNADGTPQRWRVNGQVKTWKKSPERVRVPLARGLCQHGYLTEDNLDQFSTNDPAIRAELHLQPIELALCEASHLVLRPNTQYMFVPHKGCNDCITLYEQAQAIYGKYSFPDHWNE